MSNKIILLICLVSLLLVNRISYGKELDSLVRTYSTYKVVNNQAELFKLLSQHLKVQNLIVNLDESWQTIYLNQTIINVKIHNMRFRNFNSKTCQIKGIDEFRVTQLKWDSLWAPNIEFYLDSTDTKQELNKVLEIRNNWHKMYSLTISGYDSLCLFSPVVANKIYFPNAISMSHESFSLLHINKLSFNYDINKNRALADFIDFQITRTITISEDSAYNYPLSLIYIRNNFYEVDADFANSASFSYFLMKVTPVFLSANYSAQLYMYFDDDSSRLKYSIEPLLLKDEKLEIQIKCLNSLNNHSYVISEISKVPYSSCIYSVDGKISCKDLKQFDKKKKLNLWLYETPRMNKLIIYLCLLCRKNTQIIDLSK